MVGFWGGGKGLGSGLGVVFDFVSKSKIDRSASGFKFASGFDFWEESVLRLALSQKWSKNRLPPRTRTKGSMEW